MRTYPVNDESVLERAYRQTVPMDNHLITAYRKFKHTQSVIMALHLASRLVNTFLDFHGLRHDHPACRVWVQPPDLDGKRSSDFTMAGNLNLTCTREIGEYSNWEGFQRDTVRRWAESCSS